MTYKPSFFERLTGTAKTDFLKKLEINHLASDPTPPNLPVEEKKLEIKNHNLNHSNLMEEQEKNKPTKKKEDWLAESEGQLTIDVYQTSSEIVIKSTIAGVKPEDIDVSITNDMVTIKGKRQKDEEVKAEDYFYQECYWGPFSRSVILPVEIDAELSVASIKNGILTIRMPKIEKVKTKKLKVKAE